MDTTRTNVYSADAIMFTTCTKDLIAVYDEYIKLLEQSESGLVGIAHVHGWRCPPELMIQGIELRAKIKALRAQVEAGFE